MLHATYYMLHATRTNGLGLLEPEGDGQMVKWEPAGQKSPFIYTGFIPGLLEVHCKLVPYSSFFI